MTTEQVLREVRRRIGDVDGILDDLLLDYGDEYIFEYIDSAVIQLKVFSIITETEYTVTGTSISPDPEDIDGMLIASLTATQLLRHDTVKRVQTGEMGVRFRSGEDELSTVEAARLISRAVDKIETDYRGFVMAKLSAKSTGVERTQ